jgi:hypothetical protein
MQVSKKERRVLSQYSISRTVVLNAQELVNLNLTRLEMCTHWSTHIPEVLFTPHHGH